MGSYKDLDVYKLAHDLSVEVHKMTLEQLPKFEMYEEGSQIRRSSKAIAANIVEGFGRKKYQQDYVRFLIIAHSSCNETIEHLELLYKCGSLKDKNIYEDLQTGYDQLGRKLNKLIQVIKKNI